jgi:hypothetical protein
VTFRRLLPLASAFVAAGMILWAAWTYVYYSIFSGFMQYDDEGYLLITQKLFFDGQPLYDRVFSQYGPFYYLYYGALRAAGLFEVTHDSTRIVTTIHWLLAATCFAAAAYRLTKRFWFALFVLMHSVLYLADLMFEPGHPISLIAVQTGFVTFVVASWNWQGASIWPFVLTGALIGATAATKINAGAFMYLAMVCGIWYSGNQRLPAAFQRIEPWISRMLALGAVSFAAVFMRQNIFSKFWAFNFCLVVTTSVAAVLLANRPLHRKSSDSRAGRFPLIYFHVGFACVLLASAAYAIARGSTVPAMWHDLVSEASKLPLVLFTTSDAFTPAKSALAALSLVLAAAWRFASPGVSEVVFVPLNVLKLFVGTAFIISGIVGDSTMSIGASFAPWIWLVVVQPPNAAPATPARFILAAAASFMMLYGYPIFATQGGLATALMVPVFSLAAFDAAVAMQDWFEKRGAIYDPRVRSAAFVALAAVYWVIASPLAVRERYFNYCALEYPGAQKVRLNPRLSAELDWVVNNLRARGGTFVSFPGMNSLYFWSELSPPTGFNCGQWSALIDTERQRAIINAIDGRTDVCAITSPIRESIASNSMQPPLVRYMVESFEPALRTSYYTLSIRNGVGPQNFVNVLLHGARQFGPGGSPRPLAQDFVPSETEFSLALSFRTARPGAILGQQNKPYPQVPSQNGSRPLLYIGDDGLLRSAPSGDVGKVISSAIPILDNNSHDVAIVSKEGSWTVYLDGNKIGSTAGPDNVSLNEQWQLGDAYCSGFPQAAGGWFPLTGSIADVRLIAHAMSDEELFPLGHSPVSRVGQGVPEIGPDAR